MRRIVPGLIVILVLIGFAAAQQKNESSFELFRNMIFIPVYIAGSGPLSFVLDTGTAGNMISATQAESLGLKTQGKERAYGVGDDARYIAFANDVAVSVSGLPISRETIGVYPFANLDRQMGRRIDGVIGSSVFRQYVVDLNYSERTVRFFDPRRYSDSGRGTVVYIKIQPDGTAVVNAQIAMPGQKPIDARLAIDTGSNEPLSFNRPFVEKNHFLELLKQRIPSTESGYSGESASALGRIDSVTLGGFVIKNPIAGFSQAGAGASSGTDDDGTIGNPLLMRFHIVFNYARDIMIIEPNAGFDDPFEFDMSGLRLAADGVDLHTIRVLGVIPGSPAAGAGIRPDDTIEDFNGVPAAAFDLDRLGSELKQEGRDVFLTVRRGSQRIAVHFTLKRLL